MRDFRTLKFLDFFRKVFESFGINYPLMRRILTIKLTMDGRRVPTVFSQQTRNKNKAPEENGFMKSLWMYALLGLMLIPIVSFGDNYFFQMSIFFGVVMFLVMTSMISDFSNVLLDLRDKAILLTKPVDKRTITAAKTLHIFIYLFYLTAAMCAVPIIVGTVRHGLLFLLLTVSELILLDIFIVVLTAIIYYYILRFFDGEKLKDIINYVQIGLSLSIAIGYQILARSFTLIDMDIMFSPSWWHFFIPPIWFGASFEVLLNHHINVNLGIFSIMALIIPIIGILVYNQKMPTFERNLQKLGNMSGKSKRLDRKWKNWLITILCRTKEEKAFFRFADNMMRNEREFRLKVYPSLGIALVMPFVFILNEIQFSSYEQLLTSKWYLVIYLGNLVIPNAIIMLKYSGKYKGAWIYRTLPLKSTAPLYSATIKVFLVNLYLPIYLILSAVFIVIFGIKMIPNLLIVFVTAVLYTIICSASLKDSLPFSESFEDVQASSGLKIILSILIMAVFIGIHFVMTLIPFGVYIYFILLLGVTVFAWKRACKTWWSYWNY